MFRKLAVIILLLLNCSFALPKLAIIIDDLGPRLNTYGLIAKIKYPLTLSIMPAMSKTKYLVETISTKNREILIHFPWEALKVKVDNYPIKIDSKMSDSQIKKMINRALEENPRAIGVNNHMGSLISLNERILQVFMADLSGRGLFFIDSHTIANSKAYTIAKRKKVFAAKNNVFLDYKNEENSIRQQFSYAVNKAKKQGQAIAICHANRKRMIKLLPLLMSKYADEVEFVVVSQLVK